jgi:hypothetical protein
MLGTGVEGFFNRLVNSANCFALCVFSEVLHSPDPMLQGFLCSVGDLKLCVYIFSAK